MTNEQKLREVLLGVRETLRDFAENWDCDSDSHRYGTTCRVCDAEKMNRRVEHALVDTVVRLPDGPLSERLRPDSECAPWVIDDVKKLERKLDEAQVEAKKLREIISKCASSIQNGSFCSPEASLEFMGWIPDEIKGHVDHLNDKLKWIDHLKDEVDFLRRELEAKNGT